jgi:hypothetical protein
MDRLTRRSRNRLRGQGRAGQTAIMVGVGALLAAGLSATGEFEIPRSRLGAGTAVATALAPGENDFYTGSILYTPREGKTCRQVLFDNQTGRLTDNGLVDCERAAYRRASPLPKQWSAARMRVISMGFRER